MSSSSSWDCTECTYRNPSSNVACEMCETPRPSSSSKNGGSEGHRLSEPSKVHDSTSYLYLY